METQESNAAERSREQSPFTLHTPHEMVEAFCGLLADELEYRSANSLDAQALRRYYRNLLLKDGAPSPLSVNGYANRLAPALLSLKETNLLPDCWMPAAAMGQSRSYLPYREPR